MPLSSPQRHRARPGVSPEELGHRWYFAEWAIELGRTQADAERALGWPSANISKLWRGKQRYTQHHVDAAASWLGIQPYELLLRPEDALALRQLINAARRIVAEEGPSNRRPPAVEGVGDR